jgi:S1-C subfamily serine protease
MFSNAAAEIRESLYGVIARSVQGAQTVHDMGSGMMIAPSYVITNAHLVHLKGDAQSEIHKEFLVIRSPDIGKSCTAATLLKEDSVRDLALLKIDQPSSTRSVTFEETKVPTGTICGSLGFPLSTAEVMNGALLYRLAERFQGAFVSSYFTETVSSREISWYEVDRVMYGGSSGCPFFLENGKVFGLQSKVRTDLSGGGNAQDKRNFLAISLLIPSMEIIKFAKDCGVI